MPPCELRDIKPRTNMLFRNCFGFHKKVIYFQIHSEQHVSSWLYVPQRTRRHSALRSLHAKITLQCRRKKSLLLLCASLLFKHHDEYGAIFSAVNKKAYIELTAASFLPKQAALSLKETCRAVLRARVTAISATTLSMVNSATNRGRNRKVTAPAQTISSFVESVYFSQLWRTN